MKKFLLLPIIFILIMVGIILYNYYQTKSEEQLIKDCMIRANEDRKVCFPGSKPFIVCKINENQIIKTENLSDIKCGETIMYTVNLNLATKLPEEFYACALYDKLLNVTEWRCIEQVPFPSIAETSYINGGKQVLTCFHILKSNSTPIMFFYKGTIPNITKINLLEFYIFSPNIPETSQKYFEKNLNLAEKVYELQGNVVC
ncbi:MAG: hypothetical protein QW279_13520 [Candidatus Jordarchaeaceae archaeon]